MIEPFDPAVSQTNSRQGALAHGGQDKQLEFFGNSVQQGEILSPFGAYKTLEIITAMYESASENGLRIRL